MAIRTYAPAHRLRRDDAGLEGPVGELLAFTVVVTVVILFVVSLTGVYETKADYDRRLDLYEDCLSISTTVLNHPLLLEDMYREQGLYSGAKLAALRGSYEQGGSDGGTDGEGLFADFNRSLHTEGEFGWELYIQDLTDYPSHDGLTFSMGTGDIGYEVQSLVWLVDIFVDIDEVHAARLTVRVWEV